MSRSRCAWIWRGSAVGLSRSSGMFTRVPSFACKPFWLDSDCRQGPIGLIRTGHFGSPELGAGHPSTMTAHRIEAPERRTSWPKATPKGVVMAGEAPIKQAVKWIDDQLHDNPGADRVKLVDEASRRFDLSPLDADFLFRHLGERTPKT